MKNYLQRKIDSDLLEWKESESNQKKKRPQWSVFSYQINNNNQTMKKSSLFLYNNFRFKYSAAIHVGFNEISSV
jgi:hypothetical protein